MARKGPTRKELILRYLQARPNQWVPGMELMTQHVGGTRAGARMFELTEEGYDIQSRPSKVSSVYEYRLVVPERPPIVVQQSLFDTGG